MEPRPTLREFAQEIALGWATVLSVASLAFLSVSLVPQDTIPLPWLRGLFVVLAVGCLWVASFIVWKRERAARRAAERKLSNSFRFDVEHEHNWMQEGYFQHQRVAVTATGGDGVEKALVKLVGISPCPDSLQGRLPDILRPVHVFTDYGSDPFPMNPGDISLINVFSYVTGEEPHLRLWTTSPAIDRQLPVGEYEIELMVSGSPAQAESRRFKIGVANERSYIHLV